MRTVGILLAAGSGQRFGQDNRRYRLPSGDTLLMNSLRKLETAVDHVAVVLRPDDELLAAELSGPRVSCCINPRPANGMGSSLAGAVRFVVDADAWLMIPTDFPLLRERTIRQVGACGWRILTSAQQTATWSALRLWVVLLTLCGHEGFARAAGTSVDHPRQALGTRWHTSGYRGQPPHEAGTAGHPTFSATRAESFCA